MLSLNWVNRDKCPATKDIPLRVLKHESSIGKDDNNLLIHGDNLASLRALTLAYSGKIKTVFIDPPYNTGHAFTQYEDSLEHSIWLSMMFPRLRLLRDLLKEDGSIWITIDENEAHYLKLLCDEVFGRQNFITTFIWNHRKSKQNDCAFTLSHNHVLVYAKNASRFKLNREERSSEGFENPDNDPRGPWKADPFDAPNLRPNLTYPIKNPNTGESYMPPAGRCWRTGKTEYDAYLKDNRILFGKTGKSSPKLKSFLTDAKGISVGTFWDGADVGTATEGTKELQKLGIDFDTPKPERLLKKIIGLSSNPGDIVLDSFLGSATTCAVAHKMGRKWIGIEMGDHFEDGVNRLTQVVDGEQGGISEAVNWHGGGGFKTLKLSHEVYNARREFHGHLTAEDKARLVWQQVARQWEPPAMKLPFIGESNGNSYYLSDCATDSFIKKLGKFKGNAYIYCDKARINPDEYKKVMIKTFPEALTGVAV